jgi:Linalool dehydratase/isomerase
MAAVDIRFQELGTIEEQCGAGRVSQRLMWRAMIIYLGVCAIGLAPSALGWSPAWQTAGLGLLTPGGGFIALGGWFLVLFALTVLLALVASGAWLLMGNVFAPVFVWLGSAVLAAALSRHGWNPAAAWIVPALVLAALGAIVWKHRQLERQELERRTVRNAYLPQALQALAARAAPVAIVGDRQLSADDLQQLRYALDRGLQSVDSFQGFDVIEQFQTSALRYQIDHLLWALQIAQCHYTPNFHGYLSQAQRNLIDKLTQPKVWKFWRWENLFGNLSLNCDPIAKDNIMFGGFSGTNVALYTANTGDAHYLEDGSLTFRWNASRSYRHSLRTILAVGAMNRARAVYAPLYPCEPKLTYSACNLWGNFSALVDDRMQGRKTPTDFLENLRAAHLSEMICRDGSVHAGRVTPLGIRIPVYTCNFVFALWGWMANAFFPDLSRRAWAILREECVRFNVKGEVNLLAAKYDQMDTGNYRKGEGGLYAHCLVLAREQGDEEVATAILRKLDRDFGRREIAGVVSYDAMSNLNNAIVLMGRLMRTADLRRMTIEGPPPTALRGPVLTEASYPEVLVAKAFSHGDDLDLVLYPGAGATSQRLKVERLRPSGLYRLEEAGRAGRDLRADSTGGVEFIVQMTDRIDLRLAPRAA